MPDLVNEIRDASAILTEVVDGAHLFEDEAQFCLANCIQAADRIEVLEAEVNNAEANHIHLSNLVQELEAELEKYQKLFEAAIAGHADALMKKETK